MRLDIHITNCSAEELQDLAPWVVKALENSQKRWKKAVEDRIKEMREEDLPAPPPPMPEPVEQPEEPAPLQEGPKYDLEQVRGLLNTLKVDKGTEIVRTLLEKLGVKRVPDIPEEKYPEVVDLIAKCYEEGK